MNTAPLTEVRDNLRQVVDDVMETGDEYVITRHGKSVAVVLAYDDYEAMVETMNILSDDETVAALTEGLGDLSSGDTVDLEDV